MSTTQVLFAIALSTITLVITGFALYALSSTMWSGRWYQRTMWSGRWYQRRHPDDPVSR